MESEPEHFRRVHIRSLQRRGRGGRDNGKLYVSLTVLLRVVFGVVVDPTHVDTTQSKWSNQTAQGQERSLEDMQAMGKMRAGRGARMVQIQRQLASAVERSVLLQADKSNSVSFLGLFVGDKGRPLKLKVHSAQALGLDEAVYSAKVRVFAFLLHFNIATCKPRGLRMPAS